MTAVAIHPRVAQLRGYPRQKIPKQQNHTPKPITPNSGIKHDTSEKLNEVAKWVKTPRVSMPLETNKHMNRPPPFRRNIEGSECEDTLFSTQSNTEFKGSTRPSKNHNDKFASGSAHEKHSSSPQPVDYLPLINLEKKSIPLRPAPAPSLTRFLSGLIDSITGHSTSTEYPRGHNGKDKRESDGRPSYRPPSRLGCNRMPSDAHDSLQELAGRSDAKKVNRKNSKGYRYSCEALLDVGDDEEDLADVQFSDSDDEEEKMRNGIELRW
ncbi:hypothetical protein CVT25_006585 [Psilocybe cyanescens]|uniref:Uncharacterized protein n=1 Tax=Psilocybe cyanescens TaxID=93625 RepID=A0A409X438_PSICY|nr:hypothetical protein CVT25_006585 [Psilocybe cyanescens]